MMEGLAAVCLNAIDNYGGDRPAISGLEEQSTIRARSYRSRDSDAYFVGYDLNFAVSVHCCTPIPTERQCEKGPPWYRAAL
jgi:hypothetical protein